MGPESGRRTSECGRFDAELIGYLEGDNRPFVTSHVRECVYCAVLLADLEQVRSLAQQFPLEEPSPAVWANLHARLEQEGFFRPPSSRWGWLSALRSLSNPAPAAALACLAVLGAFLIAAPNSLHPQPATTSELLPASHATASSAPSAAPEGQLARTVADLEATYKANSKFIAPELRATYDKGLSSLDVSIRECRDSLVKEPDNTLAQDYLVSAYTQKAEVLATALEYQGQ